MRRRKFKKGRVEEGEQDGQLRQSKWVKATSPLKQSTQVVEPQLDAGDIEVQPGGGGPDVEYEFVDMVGTGLAHYKPKYKRSNYSKLLHADPERHISLKGGKTTTIRFFIKDSEVADWYKVLPDNVKALIEDARFGDFMKVLASGATNRGLVPLLAEKW